MEQSREFLQVSEGKFLFLWFVSMTSVDWNILCLFDFFYFLLRVRAKRSKKIKKKKYSSQRW